LRKMVVIRIKTGKGMDLFLPVPFSTIL